MKKLNNSNLAILLGFIFLFLAVFLGAFGAHALKKMISAEALVTFETGNRYQFIHGISLVLIGLIEMIKPKWIKIKFPILSFSLGIVFFSFNCYLYAILAIKTFAMLVPIGGVLFLLGWAYLIKETLESSDV